MLDALLELQSAVDLWRSQRGDGAGVAARRDRRLAALVSHARTSSPFYRHHYRNLPDRPVVLTDLPPTTKSGLMAAFDDWVTDPGITEASVRQFVSEPERIGLPFRNGLLVCTSSGTTGHPGIFIWDRHTIALYRAMTVVRLDVPWLGWRDWVALFRRGPRWASVMGTGGHFAGAAWIARERLRGGWRRDAYRQFSVQQPLSELVVALNAFDPTILTGYPTVLELLAEEQTAGRLRIHPIFVETGGESTLPGGRERVAEMFGCPVHDTYGASECLFIAASCSEGWLHVNGDWVIVEPVEQDYSPTPPGVASHTALLTSLANRVQPIIRYDLGDSITAKLKPCPCGSPLPAVRVSGRRDDVLRFDLADGSVCRFRHSPSARS